jgi:nitroimidazol reductase NimA-like FMN-containing flavoprotein (pyridoxamine 5'-phosphate oxidase superfamily)
VEETALRILNQQRLMAISTLRPDGWPQTTYVGYANDGFSIYFLIFSSSQKFANIMGDARVAIAVRNDAADLGNAAAVYAGAQAHEAADNAERQKAWSLLVKRHPNLTAFELPELSHTAMMRADCKHVSVLDYRKGLGHNEAFTIEDDGAVTPVIHHHDKWGSF